MTWRGQGGETLNATYGMHRDPVFLGMLVIVLPLNTAESERDFHKMNLIKSSLRTGMKNDLLDALMRIAMRAREYKSKDEWTKDEWEAFLKSVDWESALSKWRLLKDRNPNKGNKTGHRADKRARVDTSSVGAL